MTVTNGIDFRRRPFFVRARIHVLEIQIEPYADDLYIRFRF